MEYEAWKMGFDAFHTDSGLHANPFGRTHPRETPNMRLFFSWEGGWRAAAMCLAESEGLEIVGFDPNGYVVR